MGMSKSEQHGEPAGAASEAERAKLFVRFSLFNLFLGLLSLAAILGIRRAEKSLSIRVTEVRQRQAEECASRRVITAKTPQRFDPEGKSPPQDAAKSGYIGKQGIEIRPAMRLVLEALQPGAFDRPPRSIRLGSQEVLPSGAIHVVNLWATWCEPCRKEMPDFQALFARRLDWGDQVRFVPITALDDTDPARAYRDMLQSMPKAPVMLADRSGRAALTKTLSADPKDQLFHGNLPVTLVLDCNRRVRWAQFNQLTPQTFAELEKSVDDLRAELTDEGPDAWCKRSWAGNGRCEGNENTPGNHVIEDCGELKRKVEAPIEAPLDTPPPAVEACPEGMVRAESGECARKLRLGSGSERAETKAAAKPDCGNATCDAGEDSDSCCQDCGCADPLVCRASGDGLKCQVKGLKIGATD